MGRSKFYLFIYFTKIMQISKNTWIDKINMKLTNLI